MKKRFFAVLITVALVTVCLFSQVSAQTKFSEYDFSGWTEIKSYFEDYQSFVFPDWRHPFKETDTDLIPEGWKYEKPAGAADSEIVNESGDIGFFPSPNSELYTKDAISNPYVWVMRTRLSAGKVAQYIVRATHEKINNVRFTDPDGT